MPTNTSSAPSTSAAATAARVARLAVVALPAALVCAGGCASPVDRDLADRRAHSLYADGAPPPRSTPPAAPAPEGAPDSGQDPGQDPDPFDATDLRACVQHGLARSAELRAAFEEWRALTERVDHVAALPDPRFTWGEFLEEVQTRTGPQERRLALSQAFPWPGKLEAEARVADRRAEAAWHRVDAARLRVARDVEVAFHEYAFLARELGITADLVELLRGLEPVVQSRVRAGAGQADLLRLQVEIGRLEDDLASLRRRRPATSARLADAMSVAEGAALLPLAPLAEPDPRRVDAAAAYARALERSPSLRELDEHLAADQEAEGLAGYRRKPGFAVGVDYIQTGDAVVPMTPGSGDDPILVSLSVSLPVWGASYSAAEREARHRVQAAAERIVAARSGLRAQVEEQAYRVEDAARRIELYRDSLIPRAREALDLTLAAYRTGGVSVLDLIDSERALLEFELSFWRACREQLQGEARLRALTGGDPR